MSSSVGRNSLIMASGTAASRITGQIRTILLAAAIGTTGMAANAYQAGSMIPQVIYTLVSGGIFNAVLVPHIVRTLKADNAEEQLNKIVTFAVTLLAAVTVLMGVLTPFPHEVRARFRALYAQSPREAKVSSNIDNIT